MYDVQGSGRSIVTNHVPVDAEYDAELELDAEPVTMLLIALFFFGVPEAVHDAVKFPMSYNQAALLNSE